MSFRSKLALVVVPPLIVMAILAAAVIGPQLSKASGADDDRRRVVIAEAAMQLSDELELEQGLAVRRVHNDSAELIAQLDDQRAKTDALRATFIAAAGRVGQLAGPTGGKGVGTNGGGSGVAVSSAGAQAVADAVAAEQLIDATRRRSDAGQLTFEVALDQYSGMIDSLNTLSGTLLRQTSNVALLRRAEGTSDQVDAKSLLARAVARIAGRLDSSGAAGQVGTLIARDYAEFQSDFENSSTLYGEYGVSADAAGKAALAAAEAVPEVGTLKKEATRIIDAGTSGGSYAVLPSDWWRVGSTAIGAYDQLDDAAFARYLAIADQQSSDAQRKSVLYAIATVLAALLAAAFAFLLGRSLSRRLQEVTDSAREIAVDRLPEVLESLRNPTPEALAGAIPKVVTRSTDEIGSLAESFNTVLRTSVETSIEHSTRRAETLTNLLINLGRRNQALLERQLQLIDTLEAREQDPGVLDGLFKLDHMVTRQRRNAESLLVLAGSRRSRAWSEPVPISDVVRGAISEVADMGRVDFDIQPGNDLLVAGSHAVDLSHLLAELIENATAYSNPTTSVQVRVQRNGFHVRIWVIDSGVGMTDDEIASANLKVDDPPDIDELTTDQVGFQVVGRLARRLGAQVRLQTNPVGGVAAGIDLPPASFETLSADLPIVEAAEAEARNAAPAPMAVPSVVADDQTLADLSAASETTLDGGVGSLPSTGSALPRRVKSAGPPAVTPLFGRNEPAAASAPTIVAPPVAAPTIAPETPVAEPVAISDPDFGFESFESIETVSAHPAELPASSDLPFGFEPIDVATVAPSASAEPDIEPLPLRRPAPVVAEPSLTHAGLARRTPGASLGGSAPAIEAELGLFRRLPGGVPTTEHDPSDRLRTLRAFSRGVEEARHEDTTPS